MNKKNNKSIQASTAKQISIDQHAIDPNYISIHAIHVIKILKQAGFEAFIVGGAVRDLILGIIPKDFDVSTNATPRKVQKLFPRAYLIGRRFQIVHVHIHNEIIEVSTFRGNNNSQNHVVSLANTLKKKFIRKKSNQQGYTRQSLGTYGQSINANGQIVQDNIWGNQAEDAWRRDLTINAMYYDPIENIIFDYHSGFEDTLQHKIQIIGDPNVRFREDPVRMLRTLRFSAKLNFHLNQESILALKNLSPLLKEVSPARLFDETLKLFLSGYAAVTFNILKQFGFTKLLLPTLPNENDDFGKKFIFLLLTKTDQRILQKRHISPAFTLAGLLWPAINQQLAVAMNLNYNHHDALIKAIQIVLSKQNESLNIPKRYLANMRDIWLMQPRFENKKAKTINTLLNHPKLRSGYDLFLLRCEAQNKLEHSVWWTTLIEANTNERQKIINQLNTFNHTK